MKEKSKVILCTTIYEKSFREVLKESHWFFKFSSSDIFKKVIIVNNIKEISRDELNELINIFSGRAQFVDHLDIKRDALDFFNCDLNEEEQEYWYSIQYFCQMYISEKMGCDYVFNVGADCTIFQEEIDDFIEESIEILNINNRVLLTTLPWSNVNFNETGIHEQNFFNIPDRHDLFWTSKVVSDQVFMVKPKKLLGGIFNIKENLHSFPGYGGNSFEKRFCNHLIKNDYLRAIYKKYYYIHNSY
jgi:hypothetical protein